LHKSLLLTFQNPKHAAMALYNYSCVTPQNPIGNLRRPDGTPKESRSSPANALPSASTTPPRIRTELRSRPLTTDAVARRFIAGHLGIKATPSPERRQYDKLVRTQAQQAKEEQARQKEKEKEEQRRQEEELKNVWEKG